MNLSEHVTLYIQSNTKKGESLADFLLDTMHGRTPYAKFAHQFKAVELLTLYGGFIPDQLPTLDNLPARNDASGKSAKKVKKHKVTEKQLLNYDIIRMLKQDTRNGELLVDLLIHVAIEGKMSNSRRFISPSTRMRAAQELLTRGFGAVSPRRLPTGKNDGLGATISKRIRKDTDNGREAAAYLMDIVAGNPPHTKPSKRKRFTPHRRVLAACELLRRLCDIRTDHITPEHIQAYWTSQTPIDAHARETHANSRPDINRTGIDKATALAAMATKPTAATDKPSTDDNAMDANPAAETQTAAASDEPNNAAAISEPSNTADKPAAQDTPTAVSAQPKDPFPPSGKATMGTSPDNIPTTDGETRAATPAAEPSNNANTDKPDAATEPSNTDKPDNTDTPTTPSHPTASALNSPSNTTKPISAETPADASKPAISNTADASNPSNPANNATINHEPEPAAETSTTIDDEPEPQTNTNDETAPNKSLRPSDFALNNSPKLTRQQRRQAKRKQKKAQRRAQRKARSP